MRPLASLAMGGLSILIACTPAPSPLVERGERLATERGCVSCHSTDGSAGIGPTWKGLAESQVELTSGEVVLADDAYLRESMTDPSAKTVRGFKTGLMERVIAPGSLSDSEVRALIAYVKSLR
ncbi:MAG TPA: cytochrome c [Actinomycetota bacterium]|nr:cytochrome c [Actinomycetota bacterium]